MPVEVVDETAGDEDALCAAAERAASAILSLLGRPDDELCVVLVGDERIRELNRDWRGKDKATDVLSFSMIEDLPGDLAAALLESDAPRMLGDVVVSVDTLRRQAADGDWTDDEELSRLVLHGVLHLVGHDHEEPSEAATMRAEEARLVAMLAGFGIVCAWEGDAS